MTHSATIGGPNPLKRASTLAEPEVSESTVGFLVDWGRSELASGAADASPREAILLLRSVLDLGEAQLRADLSRPIRAEVALLYREQVARRVAGEPIAYILGMREFFGRSFAVDPRVLIPRPETEHLVEYILATDLVAHSASNSSAGLAILDLGTGSGCLAITLASEIPAATVTAADFSLAALAVADHNARQHSVRDRVRFLASDWCDALDLLSFDLVVANPPYLSEDEWRNCAVDIRSHEPAQALVAVDSGLAVYRRLAASFSHLMDGCHVVFEIGSTQGNAVASLCQEHLENVTIHTDLSGLPRVVVGIKGHSPE